MAILAASRTANSQPESSSPTPRSPSLHPTDDDQPLFEGDFFGTYGEDDIEWSGDDRSESGDEENGPYDAAEWEPPIQDNHDEWEPPIDEGDPTNDFGAEELDNQEAHQQIEQRKPITGRPTRSANATYGLDAGNTANIYAPFASQMDWDIAKWAKLRGTSSTAFTDLLEIDGFKCEQIIAAGEAFDVFYRDIIECIKALYSNPDFANFLVFAPERHYTDEDHTVRLFHYMHTGQWWWDTQTVLDQRRPGATVIPVIISSDKTQVTMFRNKSNIPKEIHRKPSHRAHILLAYLPTTRLEHITNKASRRCTIANLYHACVSRVLAPLKTAGIDGLVMSSGDGAQHHCHPLFACFAGNYPEQLLATGVMAMECPKCDIPTGELESNTAPFELHDLHTVLDALASLDDGDLVFVQACCAAGIKPVIHPFWEDLPHANIFQVITPDVLHQLYQGLIKHLLGWLAQACGTAEINARCRCLPPNHHIRLFMKGITSLSRLSGTEHSQICQFLLGLIIDIRLPGNLASSHLLKAIHGLLDFLYLTQYPYNYNTEYTEQLHIDLAKDAYRATNHKDKFMQMTQWLEQKEKIIHHKKFIKWCFDGDHAPCHPHLPDLCFDHTQKLMKHPKALAHYIAQQQNLNEVITRQHLEDLAASIHLPFHTVPVYHKIKWLSTDARGHGDLLVTVDSIHARPHYTALRVNDVVPARFDIALINDGTGSSVGVKGFRIGQIHVVFSMPPSAIQFLFPPENQPPKHLAYVEWFTPFPATPDPRHSMYKIRWFIRSGERVTSIIPVSNITCSVHLVPKFGAIAPRHWTSNNVLEECNTFFVNCYIDRHSFVTLRSSAIFFINSILHCSYFI
ncbi:hypothetical protein DFH29DRAFT_1016884 [Suillus ampliporus]|nr:hypothetical protein DFH29DRAFT_1016884 [Suillus ampliporus]